MGQELDCTLRWQQRTLKGRAYLETDHLRFRGDERLKFGFKDLIKVSAANGILKLESPEGSAEFELGKAAPKWVEKILHPPSLLDKLGVKEGLSAKLVGDFDPAFSAGMKGRAGKGKQDLIFFAARQAGDLRRLPELARGLKPAGGLWVVYPKGVTIIRESNVLQAGRAAGLKDVKVCGFSSTHTGLKFVIPLADR